MWWKLSESAGLSSSAQLGIPKLPCFHSKDLKSFLSHSLLALLDDLLASHGVQAATALFVNDFEPTKKHETRWWAFNLNTFSNVVPWDAVRLKCFSLWERCLLKTGPPATVVKNILVWCRKCLQLSRICFFGASNKCEKVNVKSTETENGWIDKKGFEKQNSGGAPGPQLSQSESHWKYLSYDMSSWNL